MEEDRGRRVGETVGSCQPRSKKCCFQVKVVQKLIVKEATWSSHIHEVLSCQLSGCTPLLPHQADTLHLSGTTECERALTLLVPFEPAYGLRLGYCCL